jgi:PrgI family protein
MASYQIPQFLDSGDKIFLGMNIRQFAYALVGFLLCVLLFQLFFPAIGNFAFVPVAPLGLFFFYLCLGKYNGRDAEIYILKIVIFATKPRAMKYIRDYDLIDINTRLYNTTFTKLLTELDGRVAIAKAVSSDPLAEFATQDSDIKANTIKQLGRNLDQKMVNVGKNIVSQEVKIERHRQLLEAIERDKQAKQRGRR